ncbi:MAG: radical SAM protein [Theionarchaea archaeon]|nr:radical SAM protein [Theionarchaea archaeon]
MTIPFSPDDIPYIPEERITEEKEGEMYLVLAPEVPNCISVNADGKDIINVCDGRRTIKEITDIISARKGEDPEKNLSAMVAFFDYLENKKFASIEPFVVEGPSPKKPEKLISLWLNITYECNLRCRHCHSSFGSPLENELSTEEIIAVIKESSQFEECKLVISGGEPFCRDDIFQILKAASDHFKGRVLVITNGTLIDDEKAKALADIPVVVQVSLEGPDEESNDAIRGRGVFRKALKTIRDLKRLGVALIVRMTLLKTNMSKIGETIKFVKREGIGKVVFGTLQRSGRAYEFVKDIDPTTDELIEAYRKMRELDPDFTYIDFVESLKPGVTRGEKVDLCGAGADTLSVGADGGVYPCAGLMYPEFLAGNVKESSLKEIWKKSPVLEEIRSFSVSDIPGCNNCPIRYLCGGGCRVDMYWEHGNIQGKTPRCELLHTIKWDELKKTKYKTKRMG